MAAYSYTEGKKRKENSNCIDIISGVMTQELKKGRGNEEGETSTSVCDSKTLINIILQMYTDNDFSLQIHWLYSKILLTTVNHLQ